MSVRQRCISPSIFTVRSGFDRTNIIFARTFEVVAIWVVNTVAAQRYILIALEEVKLRNIDASNGNSYF